MYIQTHMAGKVVFIHSYLTDFNVVNRDFIMAIMGNILFF